MKIGVYFCNCGTNVAEKINAESVREQAMTVSGEVHFATIDFLCSEDGKKAMEEDLKSNGIDRVVVAACSPRDHEATFMDVMKKADLNPYLLQMVNIREQVAWVTKDAAEATGKASRYVTAAMKRVALHEPLEKKELDICPDVLDCRQWARRSEGRACGGGIRTESRAGGKVTGHRGKTSQVRRTVPCTRLWTVHARTNHGGSIARQRRY